MQFVHYSKTSSGDSNYLFATHAVLSDGVSHIHCTDLCVFVALFRLTKIASKISVIRRERRSTTRNV